MIKYVTLFITLFLPTNTVINYAQVVKLDNLTKTLDSGHLLDTIFIKSGIYRDIITKIDFKNYNKEIVIKPIINGRVIIKGNSTFIIQNSSNIKFEGFHFTKTQNSTFIISNSSEIKIHNNYFEDCGSYPLHAIIRMVNRVFNNEVSYNTFNKSKAMCIALFTKNKSPIDSLNRNNLFYRNIFKNTPSVKSAYPDAKTTNGMEAIMLGTGYGKTLDYQLDNMVVENLFINLIGDRQEIISNKSSGNKILRNSFINNLSGLSIRTGNNVVIKDNYFNATKRGIRIFGENHVIKNNFIDKADFALRFPTTNSSKLSSNYKEKGYQQQQNICFTHNIILSPTKSAILYDEGDFNYSSQNIIIENNKFYLNNKKTLINKGDKNKIIKNNEVVFQLLGSNSSYTNWISGFNNYKLFKTDENKGCLWKQ